MSNFLKRLSTAVVYVVLLIGSLLYSPYSAAIFFGLVSLFSLKEFYGFFKHKEDIHPQQLNGLLLGLFIILTYIFWQLSYIPLKLLLLAIPLVCLLFVAELYRNKNNPILNIATTLSGILYIIVPFCLLFSLAFGLNTSYSPNLILGFFFILWLNDTSAYLIGVKFGKNKLFPRISPNKSWEGSIGGAIFGLSMGYVNYILFPEISLMDWMVISTIIVVFGSLGDLVESLFKRSLGIKDSSNILPGHGGFLDRFDGIFIAAPMVYIYTYFMGI